MFKYLRTLNTEFHPTLIEVYVSPKNEESTDRILEGSIISINDGLAYNFYSEDKPMYLAVTGKNEDEEKPIKCMRICSNMVFEADTAGDADINALTVGALAGVGLNGDYIATGVNEKAKAKFEVIDDKNKDNYKVTVVVI